MRKDIVRREKPLVWFVARPFPPINAIGTDRVAKWVRSLLAANYDVVVFTIKPDDTQSLQNIRLSEIAKGVSPTDVRRVSMFFSDEFHGRKRTSFLRLARKIVYIALTDLFADSGWLWSIQLSSRMREDIKAAPPDLIVSTGSPFLSFLAVSNLATKHSIPYILDYRDLWSGNPHSRRIPVLTRIVTRMLERKVNKNAALLTTVSKGCAAELSADRETRVLYNIPDRFYVKELSAVVPASSDVVGYLTLFFGGTLYVGRDLAPVARALAKLPLHLSEKIRFHYCGSSSEIASTNFREHGVLRVLVDHRVLSKERTLSIMKASSVCVSVVHNSAMVRNTAIAGIMTTKIFDYIIAGKPVLNIAPKGSEIVEWFAENKISSVTTIGGDETDAIATYLMERIESYGDASESNAMAEQNHECPLWEAQFSETIETAIKQILEKRVH